MWRDRAGKSTTICPLVSFSVKNYSRNESPMASAELASTAQEEEAATRDTPCQNPDTAVEAGGSTFEPSRSVALTLISTEAGGFHVNDVAPVAVAAALDFLFKIPAQHGLPGPTVVLTAEEGSNALVALQGFATSMAEARGERRLIVKGCALPDVHKVGVPCAYLVNPCNWRLVGNGGRTNVLVNRAAGDSLRALSLEGRHRANVAESIAVKLPSESPLRAQGVDTVIQILGPNLDPRFPDCLADKPLGEAHSLLRLCYDRALSCFWDLASRSSGPAEGRGAVGVGSRIQSNQTGGSGETERKTTGNGIRGATTSDLEDVDSAQYKNTRPIPVPRGAPRLKDWRRVLFQYLEEPRYSGFNDAVYYEDDRCVVIYDAYPKTRYHLLLIPKPKFLNIKRVSALRREHLPPLRRLHDVGSRVAEALSRQGAGVVRCGYHSIPSLEPLHLHIVSQDFDSVHLKTKNHWNSFTTEFFLGSSWVEMRLEERGSLELDKDRYQTLKAEPLGCFRCGHGASNVQSLKAHNLSCVAPLPSHCTTGG